MERDDRAMILDEDRWPQWPLLPMKRHVVRTMKDSAGYPREHRDLECGLLLGGNTNPPVIYLRNLFDHTDLATVPTRAYASVDALLADGWKVD